MMGTQGVPHMTQEDAIGMVGALLSTADDRGDDGLYALLTTAETVLKGGDAAEATKVAAQLREISDLEEAIVGAQRSDMLVTDFRDLADAIQAAAAQAPGPR